MKAWELIEIMFKKPIEQIIDITTGKWLCEPCKAKKQYISKEAVLEAAKEKNKENGVKQYDSTRMVRNR